MGQNMPFSPARHHAECSQQQQVQVLNEHNINTELSQFYTDNKHIYLRLRSRRQAQAKSEQDKTSWTDILVPEFVCFSVDILEHFCRKVSWIAPLTTHWYGVM